MLVDRFDIPWMINCEKPAKGSESMEMEEDMPATTQSGFRRTSVWPGRIIGALVVVFLLFDSTIKVLKLAAAVEERFRPDIR